MMPTPLSAPEHSRGPVLQPAVVSDTERAWSRGAVAAAADARRALSADVSTPFASLDDAVERLLPFHVFGSLEGDELDDEEAGAFAGWRRTELAKRLADARACSLWTDARAARGSGRGRSAYDKPCGAVGRHV